MFLAEQGHVLDSNILEQDNKSAMRGLEKNGRMSAGQKSRHINIRYFWIKDRTESNNVEIRHCPTLEMLADFLRSLFKVIFSVDSATSSWAIATLILCTVISPPRLRSVLEKVESMLVKTLCRAVPSLQYQRRRQEMKLHVAKHVRVRMRKLYEAVRSGIRLQNPVRLFRVC